MRTDESARSDGTVATGVASRSGDTPLVCRALDFLAAGPAPAQALVEAVCHMPAVPVRVAEHIAATLLRDVPTITRADGLWALCSSPPVRPPDRRLDDLTYVVVDVETTGGRPLSGDRITEVAAVVIRRGQIAEFYETLVNPCRPIPPWVTRLTNISWAMVKDAPRFDEICDRVVALLSGHVFVAHNAKFDWGFLCAEVDRARRSALSGPQLCTVRLARRLLPDLRRRSLDYVADYYGIEITARHRAGGDAMATAKVLVQLLAAVRAKGCDTWDELQRLLASAPRRRRSRRRRALPHPVSRDTSA